MIEIAHIVFGRNIQAPAIALMFSALFSQGCQNHGFEVLEPKKSMPVKIESVDRIGLSIGMSETEYTSQIEKANCRKFDVILSRPSESACEGKVEKLTVFCPDTELESNLYGVFELEFGPVEHNDNCKLELLSTTDIEYYEKPNAKN